MAFGTQVVEHWLEREIAQLVHHGGSIRQLIAPCPNALITATMLKVDTHDVCTLIMPQVLKLSIVCGYTSIPSSMYSLNYIQYLNVSIKN